jgi:hypothetical protein
MTPKISESDYTFQLPPRGKTRYNAGPYDQTTQSPRYALDVSVPEHVRHEVDVKQFLMGSEGNRLWVWDIENKSTWPAFIIVKKDDILVIG